MNDTKSLIETSETPEITSVETPLALEPKNDEAHDKSFTCECEKYMRSACTGLPYYGEHEGKHYCVLHYPSKEKVEDFRVAFDKKLSNEDFNFPGVYFPEEVNFNSNVFKNMADFSGATFSARVDFSGATFSAKADFRGATFSAKVDFSGATFSAGSYFSFATFNILADFCFATFNVEATFREATFGAVLFRAATFSELAYFFKATFSALADFRGTTFSALADFRETTFSALANFRGATFASYALFVGTSDRLMFTEKSSLDLRQAFIENSERISFHTVTLHPHWFVNTDSRKFVFTDVKWDWEDMEISREIERLKEKRIESPHRLFSKACRQLAENAEENHRYEEASDFRYWSMEAQRLETWRGWAFWKLRWWYWAASGYGERIFRAFLVLIGVWLLSAFLYTQVGFARWEPKLTSESDIATNQLDTIGNPLSFIRAMSYSFAVMALQKPEPRPTTNTAHALVLFETVLGPLQAALLALAIRRKFMR